MVSPADAAATAAGSDGLSSGTMIVAARPAETTTVTERSASRMAIDPVRRTDVSMEPPLWARITRARRYARTATAPASRGFSLDGDERHHERARRAGRHASGVRGVLTDAAIELAT